MDCSIRLSNAPAIRCLKPATAASFGEHLSQYGDAVPVHQYPEGQSSSADAHHALHSADRDEVIEAPRSLSRHSGRFTGSNDRLLKYDTSMSQPYQSVCETEPDINNTNYQTEP